MSTTQQFTQSFRVTGMTCGHCVSAIQREVGAIPGVDGVDVDLGTGGVEVTSGRPLSTAEVAAAADEAGYELATRPALPKAAQETEEPR
jgi:copper chaperone